MAVTVNISHTFIEDLIVKLVSPAGTELVLHNKEGYGVENLNHTYSITHFAGESSDGNWALVVSDNSDFDTGSLDNWSMTVIGAPDGGTVDTPPVVTVTGPGDGSSFDQDTPITFTGTASDNEDGDLGVSLQWQSSIDGVFGTGAIVSISTLSVGDHIITASVTDSGAHTVSHTVAITVLEVITNQAPVADFSFSLKKALATFTDASSDADGAIVSWHWDFGDGNSSTEQSPSHRYKKANTYHVVLTVTDDEGETGTITKDVIRTK